MSRGEISLGAGVFVLLAATMASGQTALGTLRGVVIDEQRGALPGATVAVRQIDTNTNNQISNPEGGTMLKGVFMATALVAVAGSGLRAQGGRGGAQPAGSQ